jgi:hypothetical protein
VVTGQRDGRALAARPPERGLLRQTRVADGEGDAAARPLTGAGGLRKLPRLHADLRVLGTHGPQSTPTKTSTTSPDIYAANTLEDQEPGHPCANETARVDGGQLTVELPRLLDGHRLGLTAQRSGAAQRICRRLPLSPHALLNSCRVRFLNQKPSCRLRNNQSSVLVDTYRPGWTLLSAYGLSQPGLLAIRNASFGVPVPGHIGDTPSSQAIAIRTRRRPDSSPDS